ncbi:protein DETOXIFICATION 12-like isoform X1 [Amaranthus tricolor]|uniref:protein DETOXIFICATION 12-like isoform X1 n=1 Tax=Amaranthus tricolor TaxID=29722 RepID=UPI00258B7297|nr:protein DETOXIFICATION 12-like isoform X1 [Amaranthus tricolor]
MEEGLLVKKEEEEQGLKWKEIREEMNRMCKIAGPMIAVMMSQYMIQVVTLMMVGHLGNLYLASTSLAVSLAAVTGFSLMVGMSGGLETISGQAYGAKQYMKVGTQTYTAIFSLTILVIPLSIIWINMGKLLIILGQDPLVAHEAGKFMTYLVPTLFAYAVFQPLVRYFQSQSLVVPMFLSSCATLCLHIPLCWALVYKSGLQNLGGAIAMGLSNWLNAIFLALYMKFSPSCAATRSPLSMDIFHGIEEFLRFAIPSSAMVCFEWWSYELVILLSGLLPNAELETSVLSVCLTTTSTLFAIPYGISSAASTRVANELGAENPQAARTAAHGAVILGVANGILVSAILYATRNLFGYCFSSEKDVIKYISSLAYLVCANALLDSIQAVISGVARGCGWQHIGSFVNLVAFYVVGIPVAAGLAFWMRLNGTGLRVGILCVAITQTVCLAIISSRTNWEVESRKARRRKLES